MLWLLLPAALAAEVVGGEAPDLDAQLFRPSMGGPMLWATDASTGSDGLTARLVGQYAHEPLVWRNEDGDETALVSAVMQSDVLAAYTWRRLRAGIVAPIYLRSDGEAAGGESGLGDIGVDARGVVLDPATSPIGLALSARVDLPTTTVNAPLGNGGMGFEGLVAVENRQGPVTLVFDVGVHSIPEAELQNAFWTDALVYRAGAAWALGKAGTTLELAGQRAIGDLGNNAAGPVEAMIGGWAGLGDGSLVLRGAAGTGLVNAVGAPDLRVLLALGWEPHARTDSDNDRVVDDKDQCPDEPEDADGWKDRDGCPEPTTIMVQLVDQDGAPVEGGLVKIDGRELPKRWAELPAGTVALSVNVVGYKPLDESLTIADGPPMTLVRALEPFVGKLSIKVVDAKGKPVDAGVSFDGGDPVNTASGKLALDLGAGAHSMAVSAPGYRASTQSLDVPGETTTELVVTLQRPKVSVERDRLVLDGSVEFENYKTTILPESQALLDEVAEVLLAHPEIAKIRIEGHTDQRGDAKDNLVLSQGRAAAVMVYLLAHGVPGDRMTSVGWGESKPVDRNNNSRAWAKNRRVDFFIETPTEAAPQQ